MPSVVMKGGILLAVVTSPLTAPKAVPRPTPASAASGGGTPCTKRSAVTRPHSASSEPTERSMPAEMITKVRPRPRMALMADCCMTLSRLSALRKCGEATPSRQTMATSTSSACARFPHSTVANVLPVQFGGEVFGDEVLVVGPHLVHHDLGSAFGVEIVGIELLHPFHGLVILCRHQVLVSPLAMAGIERVVAQHAEGLLRQVVACDLVHVLVVAPRDQHAVEPTTAL